jgi:thiol-disulfide isomerase/thioredoxin
LVKTSASIKQKEQAEANIQNMPNVSLWALDSSQFSSQDWVGNSPSIIFYFDPHCEHCQDEAQALKKQAQAFTDIKLLWVSVESLKNLRDFEKKFALQKTIPQAKIARILPQDANKQFDFRVVPTILIYDKHHQLSKKFVGETKIEALIKYITP